MTPEESPIWPDPPVGLAEALLKRYEAMLAAEGERANAVLADRLAAAKAEEDVFRAERTKEAETSLALYESLHAAMLDVGKGTLERARSGAETLQKAAGAIISLYTAVLALAFSVSERPLPARGLVPAVLLGASILFSTVYLAYLSPARDVDQPLPHSDWRVAAMRRLEFFVRWTRAGAYNRRYWLHAAVLTLAFAVALIPAPFVSFGTSAEEAREQARAAVAWPTSPDTANADLTTTVYAAQVAEASALRAAAASRAATGSDGVWWVAVVVALLASLGVPIATARDSAPPGPSSGAPSPPGTKLGTTPPDAPSKAAK